MFFNMLLYAKKFPRELTEWTVPGNVHFIKANVRHRQYFTSSAKKCLFPWFMMLRCAENFSKISKKLLWWRHFSIKYLFWTVSFQLYWKKISTTAVFMGNFGKWIALDSYLWTAQEGCFRGYPISQNRNFPLAGIIL